MKLATKAKWMLRVGMGLCAFSLLALLLEGISVLLLLPESPKDFDVYPISFNEKNDPDCLLFDMRYPGISVQDLLNARLLFSAHYRHYWPRFDSVREYRTFASDRVEENGMLFVRKGNGIEVDGKLLKPRSRIRRHRSAFRILPLSLWMESTNRVYVSGGKHYYWVALDIDQYGLPDPPPIPPNAPESLVELANQYHAQLFPVDFVSLGVWDYDSWSFCWLGTFLLLVGGGLCGYAWDLKKYLETTTEEDV